ICQRLGISIKAATPQAIADSKANVVVDALFGIGLTAPPREREAALIRAVNDLQTSVVSVDVPSGLDCDNGVPLGDAAIYADETVTMFAEKAGFPADPYTGCIHVETLTIPEAWIESVL
ncbi:MAG: NAD(P)H-hydrate epimerase, partial [Planctomycetota bacterium]